MTLRFDGKVAIVTGSGAGLGRAYAHLLASRGAKVVVNDLGGSVDGKGGNSKAADIVVDEIKKAGGAAVANYDSVEFGDKIVKTAVEAFGTVDIVINNAGIIRDVSFMKMKDEDWDLIMKVHLKGSYSVARAAWDIMRAKGYGRIINTGSSSGLYGSFGQVNYSAAKMAMHGFSQALAKEGASKNIRVNTICPLAASRMTETVFPKEVLANIMPEHVAPLIAYLCHDSCEESGSLFEVGAGYVAKLRWNRTAGKLFPLKEFTIENVAKNWGTITDFEKGSTYPASNLEMMEVISQNFTTGKASGTALSADEIFGMMLTYLGQGHGKDLVTKVAAIYAFEITKTKGGKVEAVYEIDLKNGQGNVKKGKPAAADATFTMTEADFEQVCLGKLNPQMAFMQGKMKIKGNMAKATKFTPELFPPPTAENLSKFKAAKL
jgi:3-hydroxyacyl-CoA dehydrogenase/3a,7a,12a-trihydroxy-5b-cholest-24-enoyl-CoA hydratase